MRMSSSQSHPPWKTGWNIQATAANMAPTRNSFFHGSAWTGGRFFVFFVEVLSVEASRCS